MDNNVAISVDGESPNGHSSNRNQNLHKLTKMANGMLPDEVYDAIYETAMSVNGGNFVEVGTAHGAATIAMGLGLKHSAAAGAIYTMDRLGGVFSSRSVYGSVAENKKMVENHFQSAGLSQDIQLFVGTSDDFVQEGRCPESIHLLMLDADGRIDRDLGYFYEKMYPGTPIIIDDVDGNIKLAKKQEDIPYIDMKHLITSKLIAAYTEAGYLEFVHRVGNTSFFKRGSTPFDLLSFQALSLRVYRELVLVPVDTPVWRMLETFFDIPLRRLEILLDWNARLHEVMQAVRIREKIPPFMISFGRMLHRISARLRS